MSEDSDVQLRLIDVTFPHVSVDINGPIANRGDLDVRINPSAVFNIPTGAFVLSLKMTFEDSENSFKIDLEARGNFEFRGSPFIEGKLLPILSVNAPAIVYPHIRAFITAVSALSGIGTITIPVVNLHGLKDKIRVEVHD